MRGFKLAIGFCLALSAVARAQPAPSQQLGVDLAAAAVDACNAKGYGVAASVVDSAGAPMNRSSGAGTTDQEEEDSMRKARTAAVFQAPTAEIALRRKTDAALAERLRTDATFLTKAGGVPIRMGGQFVGALGVDGAPNGDEDAACASAALAKLASRLN